MLSDDAETFCRVNGVALDESGIPVPGPFVGPPKPCVRCGVMAECSGEAVYSRGDVTRTGGICGECFRLSFTDSRAYWDGFGT